MDTSALKSFAPKARASLIADVEARVAAVLAPTSTERVESPTAVARLEHAVKDAGDGTEGRAAVAERVAYTWFNRIVALRFMDANGYTGVGLVSPPAGQTAGQPEILSRARAGVIDAEVVSPATAARVAALLDGTRRSTDSQGEAYAALLEAYCRKWAETMHDMFGTGGDETELLIPSGLLADTSVRAQTVQVLTEETCQDVEVIGWLYQFYISERKDEVFAGFKKNKKAGPAEIPAATQLFTPDWIVRYLVQNSIGRLWMLNNPESGLRAKMAYYIDPVDEITDYIKISSPEEIKIVDPACGSGHMLTYAFDLLYEIYKEEGYAPSEISSLILTHNLFGIEIDPRAEALASFSLTMKARAKGRRFLAHGTRPNVRVLTPIRFTPDELDLLRPPSIGQAKPSRQEIDAFWNQFEHGDTFGSLITPDAALVEPLRNHIESLSDDTLDSAELREAARRVLDQTEYLTQRYHVAIANPPYLGMKTAGAALQSFLKSGFPASKSDLYAAFIERCAMLVIDRALVAMVTMQSWMFLASYERLRSKLVRNSDIWTMAHLGANAFDTIGGEVVSTTAFVLRVGVPSRRARGVYVRLTTGESESSKSRSLRDAAAMGSDSPNVFCVEAERFGALPGSQFAYWLPDPALEAYRDFDTLGAHAYGQPGLQTSDNARFVRLWHEVSQDRFFAAARDSKSASESGARWFPLVKGGDFRKWYGNLDSVVDWMDNGREIKESIDRKYPYLNGNIDYVVKDRGYFFRESITYNRITAGRFAVRHADYGTIFDVAGSAVFPAVDRWGALGFLCSTTADYLMRAQNPTFTVQSGDVAALPYPADRIAALDEELTAPVQEAVSISRADWDSVETSWRFASNALVESAGATLALRAASALEAHFAQRGRLAVAESKVNRMIADVFGLSDVVDIEVDPAEVTLRDVSAMSLVVDLVSYAVGCMFGRYSLDVPGLMLADEGSTITQFRAKSEEAGSGAGMFVPDDDGVLPIVDDEWFADDIVARFHEFLRVAFGEECLAENTRFVEESLGVRNLRDYFITKSGKSRFYDDHVKRYKRRPIYWMFSSSKGSFNALVYLHRYTPSTAGTVLNEYLREYQAKLATAIANEERTVASLSRDAARARKEVERLRKILTELDAYEHDVLYPLAARQVALDLDDGVKVNYPRLGAALRKIAGLEGSDE
jgi:hypothetical protein